MKPSSRIIFDSIICLALVTASARSAELKVENATPGDGIESNCDLTGYKSESQTVGIAIPDVTGSDLFVGPIQFADDGQLIADVIIDINMTHTWVGDLVVLAVYDEDCDNFFEAQANLLCRPRGTSAAAPAPCGTSVGFGCSADLSPNNTLFFDDSAAAGVADGTCVNPIPAGCYKSSSQGGSPLATFRNRHKGGCWWLNISDRAAGDSGTINSWSVQIKNQAAIAVEAMNWGTVKTIFQ